MFYDMYFQHFPQNEWKGRDTVTTFGCSWGAAAGCHCREGIGEREKQLYFHTI
jgi:hypothetical protein